MTVTNVRSAVMPEASRVRMTSDFAWTSKHDVRELFELGPFVFDVDAAKRIIASSPRRLDHIDVSIFVDWIGLPPVEGDGRLTARPIVVDWLHATSDDVDIGVPLIVAQVRGSSVVIDGWSRIAKAIVLSVPSLDCALLSARETASIRRDCGKRTR